MGADSGARCVGYCTLLDDGGGFRHRSGGVVTRVTDILTEGRGEPNSRELS